MTTLPENAQSIKLDNLSRELRHIFIEILESSQRGHIGPTLSILEIIRTLYLDILNISTTDPLKPNRDRFILSKGHGCLAQYIMLYKCGFIDKKNLLSFCKFDSKLGGHPELNFKLGIEASTGSLGHGLGLGVGIALSAKINKQSWKTFVLLGDGELQEGSNWESFFSIQKNNLTNLITIIDYNKLQSWGNVSDVWNLEPLNDKLRAFNFDVVEVNGHDVDALRSTFKSTSYTRPLVVIAHTVKGKGFYFAENNPLWHHKSKLSENEIELMKESLKK